MAGVVAQIRAASTPDSLAKQLAALFNSWWIQRGEKEAEWKELRNYLFATDTTKTTNSKLPWKNKTTIPKLTQIRDNLHANYLDAVFPNDNWVKWEGYTQNDVIKRKRTTIEAYMKNKLRESGFREVISDCLLDYIDYGNAFGEVIWVRESSIDPITGEENISYVGPKAVRISPHDHLINPIASSYSKSPKFTRCLKSLGELQKETRTRTELQYSQEVLDKILLLRKQMTDFRMEDIAKAEGYQIDGFGSLKEYYQSGLVELLDFEGDIYHEDTGELLENRIITVADRKYILRDIANPSWMGQDNKCMVSWRERPDNLYGMGPLDNLVGLQYRLDHLENCKADALDQTILPPKVIKGDVEPFEWGPGVDIHVAEDGDITTLPPNTAAFTVNNEIAFLMQLMEEMAGAPKEAMGFRTPGEKTAFEVQQLQNAAGRLFQNKVNKFEIEFMEPLINKMLELAKRHMDAPDVIRVMDDDLGVISFMDITKEDITSRGKLRPVGARHYAARAQLIQNLSGIFSGNIGEIIRPHVSGKELAKMVNEYMGFEQYNFIKDNAAVFEGKETQQLLNQAQTTLQNEMATPVEENMLTNQ